MRKFYVLWLLVASFLLISCSKEYIQIFDVAGTNGKLEKDNLVFENDTLKITYYFWEKRGVMEFQVYNKLSVPIYIDWKKSSFISNSNKLDYWYDGETILSEATTRNFYYTGPGFFWNNYSTFQKGTTTTTTKKEKPERITFIPPKSNFNRTQFYLLSDENYKMDKSSEIKFEQRRDKPKKLTRVIQKEFDLENSPVNFRNFLSLSTSEKFEKEFYVDNGFFVCKAAEMDIRHFRGGLTVKDEETGLYSYEKKLKKPYRFYIYVNDDNVFKYKKP